MKNIILIALLLSTYSCEAVYWYFLEGGDDFYSNADQYECEAGPDGDPWTGDNGIWTSGYYDYNGEWINGYCEAP